MSIHFYQVIEVSLKERQITNVKMCYTEAEAAAFINAQPAEEGKFWNTSNIEVHSFHAHLDDALLNDDKKQHVCPAMGHHH